MVARCHCHEVQSFRTFGSWFCTLATVMTFVVHSCLWLLEHARPMHSCLIHTDPSGGANKSACHAQTVDKVGPHAQGSSCTCTHTHKQDPMMMTMTLGTSHLNQCLAPQCKNDVVSVQWLLLQQEAALFAVMQHSFQSRRNLLESCGTQP